MQMFTEQLSRSSVWTSRASLMLRLRCCYCAEAWRHSAVARASARCFVHFTGRRPVMQRSLRPSSDSLPIACEIYTTV